MTMYAFCLGLIIATGSVKCFGLSSITDAKVYTGHGSVVFRQPTIVSDGKTCSLKSRIENLSEATFLHLELKATVKGAIAKVDFPLKRFSLPGTRTEFYSSPCPAATPSTGTLTLSYIRGLTILPIRKSENQQQLLTQYLWSLPTVASEIGSVLLAVDKKCARSFGKAADTGGLDGRRTLAEVRQLGCGLVVPSGEWIRINEQSGEFINVEWVAGTESTSTLNQAQSGWIEQRFVAPPKQYSFESELKRITSRRPPAPDAQPAQQTSETDVQRPWSITAVESRITDSNGSWSQVAWRLTVKNNSSQPIAFNGSINVEDEDGFILHSEPIFNLAVNAGEPTVHSGVILIKAEQINKFKRVTAQLHPAK